MRVKLERRLRAAPCFITIGIRTAPGLHDETLSRRGTSGNASSGRSMLRSDAHVPWGHLRIPRRRASDAIQDRNGDSLPRQCGTSLPSQNGTTGSHSPGRGLRELAPGAEPHGEANRSRGRIAQSSSMQSGNGRESLSRRSQLELELAARGRAPRQGGGTIHRRGGAPAARHAAPQHQEYP